MLAPCLGLGLVVLEQDNIDLDSGMSVDMDMDMDMDMELGEAQHKGSLLDYHIGNFDFPHPSFNI